MYKCLTQYCSLNFECDQCVIMGTMGDKEERTTARLVQCETCAANITEEMISLSGRIGQLQYYQMMFMDEARELRKELKERFNVDTV